MLQTRDSNGEKWEEDFFSSNENEMELLLKVLVVESWVTRPNQEANAGDRVIVSKRLRFHPTRLQRSSRVWI